MRWLPLLGLACSLGCVHASMEGALASRAPDVTRLRPASIDTAASSLNLVAPRYVRKDQPLSSTEVRTTLASALENLLSTAGRSPRPARFRADVNATEEPTGWQWIMYVPPFAFPMYAPLWMPATRVRVKLQLDLQVGEDKYAALGHGDAACQHITPRVECFDEALGLALADALGRLQR